MDYLKWSRGITDKPLDMFLHILSWFVSFRSDTTSQPSSVASLPVLHTERAGVPGSLASENSWKSRLHKRYLSRAVSQNSGAPAILGNGFSGPNLETSASHLWQKYAYWIYITFLIVDVYNEVYLQQLLKQYR